MENTSPTSGPFGCEHIHALHDGTLFLTMLSQMALLDVIDSAI